MDSMNENEIDKLFDINRVLMALFSSLETIRDEKKIELIYEMDSTIPRELKGNYAVLLQLLTQMLIFVFQNSDRKEILLSLSAPEDFMYEELMSFEIKETNIAKEKVREFLETKLSKDIEILDGKIIYDDENTSDIYISIPFKLNELGYRRHYRLPDKAMVGKKVLLISESKKITQSVKKMFKYFLYDVDIGIDEFKGHGSNLTQYDIVIIDDRLSSEKFENTIATVQKEAPLKYVLLQDANFTGHHNTKIVSANFIKPATQESIFELIISLFNYEIKNRERKPQEKKNIIDIKKVFRREEQYLKEESEESKISQDSLEEDNFQDMLEKKKELKVPVLDKKLGKKNTKKMGLVYSNELKNFLDTFNRSDIYFRQIVNEKATNRIKEFCIDLEKQAKVIGAQSMLNFADSISLLFVYNKLDLLLIYPGKYHIELQKLIEEIKIYLYREI